MAYSIKTVNHTLNKNEFHITIKNRRVDVIKNGVWIGKGNFNGGLDLSVPLAREEFSWIEKTVRSYHST